MCLVAREPVLPAGTRCVLRPSVRLVCDAATDDDCFVRGPPASVFATDVTGARTTFADPWVDTSPEEAFTPGKEDMRLLTEVFAEATDTGCVIFTSACRTPPLTAVNPPFLGRGEESTRVRHTPSDAGLFTSLRGALLIPERLITPRLGLPTDAGSKRDAISGLLATFERTCKLRNRRIEADDTFGARDKDIWRAPDGGRE